MVDKSNFLDNRGGVTRCFPYVIPPTQFVRHFRGGGGVF